MNHPMIEKGKALALTFAVAAPMAYVMQISMGIWMPAWYAIAFSLAFLVLTELVATNRYTAIIIPSGLVLLGLLAWAVMGKDTREIFSDFFWWSMYFLYGGGEYPLINGIALTAVTAFLIALYCWLFGRKFFFFPLVMAFVVGFVLFKWLQGLDLVLLPGLIAVAGLIALWAKSFQRKTARLSRQKLDENGIALFVLPLALAAVLLCFAAIPPEQAAKWQSRQVHDMFERVNNYLADYTDFNRPRHSFSIGRFGFMPMGTRLGGPTKLSEEEVLHITTDRPMLLRGVIYNEYTGQRWEDTTKSNQYRFGDERDGLRDNAFDRNRPQLGEGDTARFQRFVSTRTLSVYPIIDGSSTLFAPFRGVTDVTSQKFLGVLPRYNEKGELFSSSDLKAGYGYTVTADYLEYKAQGFDELMDRLISLRMTDPTAQDEWIRNNFTALPDGIDPAVSKLVQIIANGEIISELKLNHESSEVIITSTYSIGKAPENDYQKALAIQAFLKNNFTYTLSPSTPPEDQDFVSYFITQDPQGYCTYFATTMAVMARIAGIPSRYCEGYAMPDRTNDDGVYVVQGTNAHAWAELYFEGIGWIPFDATPSGEDDDDTGTGGESAPMPFFTPTPSPNAGNSGGEIDLPARDPLTWDDIAPYLWILPVSILALLLGWIIFKMSWAKVRVSVGHVNRKYADRRRGCAYYYFESLKLLEYYNYPLKTGETPTAYAVRIDRWLRLQAGTFGQVALLISRISYSDYAPSTDDLQFLSDFCRDLTKYTYHAVGPWFYLMHRVLGFKQKANRPKDH